MAISNFTMPPPHEVENLLQIGLAVMGLGGDPTQDLNMQDCVDLWRTTYNDSTLATKLAGRIPSDANATQTLDKVSAVIAALPRSTNNVKNSITFYIAISIITTIVVALRMYARKYVSPKKIMLEDLVCLMALGAIYVSTGTSWAELLEKNGGARHIWDNISLRQLLGLHEILFVNGWTFGIPHMWVKFSFLAFYWRFSPDRNFRRAIIASLVYFGCCMVLGLGLCAAQCQPFVYWKVDKFIHAKCYDRQAAFTAHGACLLVMDFILLILPFTQVLKLRLNRRDKILLCMIFGLGIFICVIGVVRLYYIHRWLDGVDISGKFEVHSIWYLLELDISLIVCCAPSLKVLFSHQKPKHERTIPGQSKMSFTQGGLFKGTLWKDRQKRQAARRAEAGLTTGDGVTYVAATRQGPGGVLSAIASIGGTSKASYSDKDDDYKSEGVATVVTRKGSNDDVNV